MENSIVNGVGLREHQTNFTTNTWHHQTYENGDESEQGMINDHQHPAAVSNPTASNTRMSVEFQQWRREDRGEAEVCQDINQLKILLSGLEEDMNADRELRNTIKEISVEINQILFDLNCDTRKEDKEHRGVLLTSGEAGTAVRENEKSEDISYVKNKATGMSSPKSRPTTEEIGIAQRGTNQSMPDAVPLPIGDKPTKIQENINQHLNLEETDTEREDSRPAITDWCLSKTLVAVLHFCMLTVLTYCSMTSLLSVDSMTSLSLAYVILLCDITTSDLPIIICMCFCMYHLSNPEFQQILLSMA